MTNLKLQALDAADLKILSALCQDAVLHTTDFSYQPAHRRFALVCNRFDWEAAGRRERGREFVRRQAALRFEGVTRARFSGFDKAAGQSVLNLLDMEFQSAEPPAGTIRLRFAGGAEVKLDVECVEAELSDLGAVWTTAVKPEHF